MDHQEQFRRAALAMDFPDGEVSRFLGHLRLSIRLGGASAADGALVGRFGGRPRLPVGMAWPSDGISDLPFVFSVDCAALPRIAGFDLPADGSLLFFLDHEEDHLTGGAEGQRYARVVHVPAGTETAVAHPSHPELIGEQYDVSASLVADLPACLVTDEDDLEPFQQQLARDLKRDLPHLDELSALADEVWPSSDGLASAFLGGYIDDDVIAEIAELIVREREKADGTAIPQAEWLSLMEEEELRLMTEWTSLAVFLLDADYYYPKFSIRNDDLSAGRLDKMVSMTWFSE